MTGIEIDFFDSNQKYMRAPRIESNKKTESNQAGKSESNQVGNGELNDVGNSDQHKTACANEGACIRQLIRQWAGFLRTNN